MVRAGMIKVFPQASLDRGLMVAVGTAPGVSITHMAAANGVGVGKMRTTPEGRVQWKAPGSSQYGRPELGGLIQDGDDPNKYLEVSLYPSFVQPGYTEEIVRIRDRFNNFVAGDDFTSSGSQQQDTIDYTVSNITARPLRRVRAWLEPGTTGLEIERYLFGPLGGWLVGWSKPTSYATGVLFFPGDAGGKPLPLAPFSSETLRVRRTVAAGAPPAATILNHVHIGGYAAF